LAKSTWVLAAVLGCLIAGPACAQAARDHAASGFSIHLVDDEREPGDQSLLGQDGRTYWVRSEPALVGGIIGVAVEPGSDGQSAVWLRLTPEATRTLAKFSAEHVGGTFAYVFDGRIVGHVVTMYGPLERDVVAISDAGDPAQANALAEDLLRTAEKSGS
jgi:preprotein translocase subunit SecD